MPHAVLSQLQHAPPGTLFALLEAALGDGSLERHPPCLNEPFIAWLKIVEAHRNQRTGEFLSSCSVPAWQCRGAPTLCAVQASPLGQEAKCGEETTARSGMRGHEWPFVASSTRAQPGSHCLFGGAIWPSAWPSASRHLGDAQALSVPRRCLLCDLAQTGTPPTVVAALQAQSL